MLVLSRRPDEKILLPSVPATIQVISVQSGLVRLGIEAPATVPILREELTRTDPRPIASNDADGPTARQRLNTVLHGVAALRGQVAGGDAAALRTLDAIERELHALRRQLATAAAPEAVAVG